MKRIIFILLLIGSIATMQAQRPLSGVRTLVEQGKVDLENYYYSELIPQTADEKLLEGDIATFILLHIIYEVSWKMPLHGWAHLESDGRRILVGIRTTYKKRKGIYRIKAVHAEGGQRRYLTIDVTPQTASKIITYAKEDRSQTSADANQTSKQEVRRP